MENNTQTPGRSPRSNAALFMGVLLSLALACLLLAVSAGGPVGASNDMSFNITVTATGDGSLSGIIIGSGTSTGPTMPPPTLASVSTSTSIPATTQPSATPTLTRTPKPTGTATPAVTKTPKPTGTATPAVTKNPKPTRTPRPAATDNVEPTSTPQPDATDPGNSTGDHKSVTRTPEPESAETRQPTPVDENDGDDDHGKVPPTKTPRPTKTSIPDKKITICHATHSASNPYVEITVSVNGLNGHGEHPDDIIPAPAGGCPQPTPKPQNETNHYQYTCQVGEKSDSNTGEACSDGYYGTDMLFKDGAWWTVDTFCMTKTQCQKTEGISLDQYKQLPCVPVITPEGITLQCKSDGLLQTWNLRANSSTSCPVNQVLRSPYPRSLVNVPTNFLLQPQEYNTIDGNASSPQSPANLSEFVDANGNPTKSGYDAGVWKDLVLYMRSRRFNGGESWFGQTVPKPQWTFSDRSWNTGPYAKKQEGTQATYVYQTSSAGLLTLFGREFDMVNKVPGNIYDLPAYDVTVKTFCGHEWKVTVTIATRTWHPSGACYPTTLYPDGTTYEPPGTSNDGCAPGYVSPGSYTYGWQNYQTDWAGIDLTQMGRSTSYDVRTTTQSGGMWQDTVYWDLPPGIWVPVVEVQSVLRDSCVASGACQPPSANP